MNIENTKAQMRKGVLEFCILSVLKEKDAYTSEILDTLKNAKFLRSGDGFRHDNPQYNISYDSGSETSEDKDY